MPETLCVNSIQIQSKRNYIISLIYLSTGWFMEFDYSTRTLRESYEILLKKEV